MFDNLEAHFLEGVLPAYSSFIESLKSDTAGLSSDFYDSARTPVALFHFREHVPWAKGKPWPVFLTACPEFVLLQDIVNVFKHGPRRDGKVAKPTDIYETTVMTDYEDSDGTYHHAEKEVTIQLRDGSLEEHESRTGETVLGIWITEFKSRGCSDAWSRRCQKRT